MLCFENILSVKIEVIINTYFNIQMEAHNSRKSIVKTALFETQLMMMMII